MLKVTNENAFEVKASLRKRVRVHTTLLKDKPLEKSVVDSFNKLEDKAKFDSELTKEELELLEELVAKFDLDIVDPEDIIYREVYVTISERNSRMSTVVCDGQGLVVRKCQGDSEKIKAGEFYIVNLQKSRNNSFYKIVGEKRLIEEEPNKTMLDLVAKNIAAVEDQYADLNKEVEVKKHKQFRDANDIPPIPSNLIIRQEKWDILCASIGMGKYPILLGPTGCGKTEAAQSAAKAMGYEFYAFNAGAAYKPKQFFAGMLQADENGTYFLSSEFLIAFESDKPTYIFIDEATRIPPSASNYLMTVLDRNQNYIYVEEKGKKIYKGENVVIVCAGNLGIQYSDTRPLDAALWDRLIKVDLDYPDAESELRLVCARVPDAPKANVEQLIAWANLCRSSHKSGDLITTISTRQNIDMAGYLAMGFGLKVVYKEIFLNNFINGNIDDRDKVIAMLQSQGAKTPESDGDRMGS